MTSERVAGRLEQQLPRLRRAAAHNDDVGVEHVHEPGDAHAEPAPRLDEDAPG